MLAIFHQENVKKFCWAGSEKMEVVLNKCYGGFSVSEKVYKELNIKWDNYGYLTNEDLKIKSDNYNKYRTNKKLIKAIKKIGLKEASGTHAELKIIEIPDDVNWEINEYDGIESVIDKERHWG